MKNKLPATLLPIGRISAMKSQFRGCLRLGFFLFIAASVLLTTELLAQCPVSNTASGFQMNTYTSSGQSFVPTCTNTLVSVSFEGNSNAALPDQVDIIYGEPGNSGGILYSIGNPQWSGKTHTLPFSVSVTSGQRYTVLFIRRFASDPCLHYLAYSNPISSGRAWGYTGTYGSGSWAPVDANADLTCSVNIGSCTAPAFTACPSNITVNAGASTCNAAVSYTATASGIPAPSLTYTFSGATTGSGSGTGSGSTFNRGVTTVVLTATNSCGSPTCSFTVTVNDATPPTITCPANVDIPVDPACAGFIGVYTPVSVSDNCTANPMVTQSPLAGTTFFGHGSTRTVQFTATDGAGNTQSCTFTATLKDVTPPTITCKNATVNLDNSGAASITTAAVFQIGDDNCGTVNQVSVLPNTFSCTNIGTNTVTLLVNDGHGNTATCNATVTVVDNINPTVVCKNATVNLDNSGAASITTSDVFQSGTDNCGTVNQVSVLPNTFTCTNIGTNTVTLLVNDGHGNTATCNATVTVVDNINPTVVCKNATVNLDNNGAASITTSDVLQSITDNCSTQFNQIVVFPNAFFCNNIGTNIVPVYVIGDGNNYCLATVTVVDNINPTVVCKNATVNLDNSGAASITTANVFQSGADNCGQVNQVSVLPNTFTCTNTGTNTVTLLVNDGHGNTATCNATVTVVDNINPTLVCKNATVNLDANGAASITTSDVFQSGDDNCGQVNQVSVLPNTFTCNNLGTNNVTLTVDDGHGNTSTCLAVVTVVDNINPTVICKNATVDLDNSGATSITTSDVFQSGADNCGIINRVSVLPNTFTCTNTGTNTVTLLVNDGHGNTATCLATVTVVDNINPTVVCKNATVNLDNNGAASITTSDVFQSITDNCSTQFNQIVVFPNAFFCNNIGTNIVTLLVNDGHGNTATCNATVTVVDNINPTLVCKNATVNLDNNGAASITTSDVLQSGDDNCGTVNQVSVLPNTFTCNNLGTNNVTLTVDDGHGNTNTCLAVVTVVDNINPTVICKNTTVNLDNNGAASITTADVFQSGTDNCGTVNQVSVLPNTFTCTNIGTNTVTLLVNDGHGNTATCLATVTVVDTINPTVICKNATVNLDNNGAASITTSDVFQSGGDNCGTVNQVSVLPNTFSCTNAGTNTVTLLVNDGHGNTATCNTTVTIVDNVNPTVICKNATVNLDNNGAASITTSDVFQIGDDNCGTVNQVSVLPNTFTCTNIGTNTVTLLVNDGHGNTATCLATVTVVDNINPAVICKNATVNLDNSGAASITTSDVFQSGDDNCGQVNQVSVLPNTFTCTNIGTNTVTLLVNDGHGNTATCLATVTVVDNVNPTVVCKNATVNLDANGAASITTSDVFQSGADNCGQVNQVSVLHNTFTCNNLGSNIVTLLVNDGHGNTATCLATVTVVDNINPTVICKNATVNLDNNGAASITTADAFQSGTDNCGQVNQVSVLPNTFTCNNLGANNVTLIVNDGHGNTNTCIATVTVVDNIVPTVICKNATVNLDNNGAASITTSNVFQSGSDNCGTVNQVSVLPNTVTCTNIGTNTVTLLVNDGHGNTATCNATVTVVDNINPTLVCKNATVNLDNSGAASITTSDVFQSGADNCGQVNQVSVLPNTFSCTNIGTNTVTLLVNDGHGNTATCLATVTVVDNINPTVICKNATANLDANGAASITTADVFQSGDDNCGQVNQVSVLPNTFTCSNLGNNTSILTINDGPGNTSTCNATVTVVDNINPTVICKNATIYLDNMNSITIADVFQSATDNCGTVNLVSVSSSTFTCSNVGANEVTLTVNDGHGNTSTCTATVTVIDNTVPKVNCKNATIYLDNTGTATLPAADVFLNGTDDCGTVTPAFVSTSTFTCSSPKISEVTLTVNDGHGNTSTCTATVTVVDSIAPTVTCKNATINFDNTGRAILAAADVFQSGTDNCGMVIPVSVTPDTFICRQIGTHNVTLTVNDGHGNVRTCTTTVTVADNNQACSFLPVELVDLTAVAEKEAIQLRWQTASEHNNAGFQIERSENGRDFEKIAFVNGAGTSAEKHAYQLKDKEVRAGQIYFYRLQQLDYDGSFQYSDIVQATLSGGKMTLLVSPNPAPTNSIIQLQISLPQASEVVLTLFDVQGRLIRSERHDLEANLQTLTMSIDDLPASTYFLKATANRESVYQKLIITK